MSAGGALARLGVAVLMVIVGGGTAIAVDRVGPLTATDLKGVPGPWRLARATDGSVLDFQHVLATDTGFVALGWPRGRRQRGETIVALTWWSHDGALWGPTGPIELTGRANVARLARLDDELYAVGMDGSHLAVWRATGDGSWRRLRDRAAFSAPPPRIDRRFGADIGEVVGGDGPIVVTGDYWTLRTDPEVSPVIWTTNDGRRWRRSGPRLPPPDNGVSHITVAPEGFVGLAATNRPTDCMSGGESSFALVSPTGRSWRKAARKAFGCCASDIAHDPEGGRYYAVAEAPDEDTSVILASDDLRTWSEVYRLPTAWDGQPWSPSFPGLDIADGTIAVVGDATWEGVRDGSTVFAAVSEDGDAWHLIADWPMGDGRREEVEGWAMDGSRIVVDAGEQVWHADLGGLGSDVVAPGH